MLKTIAAVCSALALYACASGSPAITETVSSPPIEPAVAMEVPLAHTEPQPAQSGFWTTLPRPGTLTFIGVSGPQSKPDAEIAAAREDAAGKVSMYHGIKASVENTQNIGSGFLDYYVDTHINMEYDQEFAQYVDKLTFDPERDVIKIDNVLCIRFSYPANFSFPVPGTYSFGKNANGSPQWTTRPPQEIGGLSAGVGFARRQLRMKDTIAKSAESAVAALVSRLTTTVTTSDISAENQNSSVVRQHSSGALSRFVVLETWIEPETQAVWTLAVAQTAD